MSRLVTTVVFGLLIGSVVRGAPEQNVLTPEEQAEGWILLFDGETMFGWRPAGSADWQVEQGMLRVRSGEQCLLRTTTQFANFVLKVEFRCDRATNSGIFLRTSPKPNDPGSDCYELNIAAPQRTLSPPAVSSSGCEAKRATWNRRWHTFEVTLRRSRHRGQARRPDDAGLHRPPVARPRVHWPATQSGNRLPQRQAEAVGIGSLF